MITCEAETRSKLHSGREGMIQPASFSFDRYLKKAFTITANGSLCGLFMD